jgi:hypothetical protein
MRELKAGLGLVFGTFAGKLYLVLILLAWIFVMFLWSMVGLRDLQKSGLSFWFFYMSFWPLSVGASQLAAGYKSVLSCGGLYCVPRLTRGMKRFSIISGFVLSLMFTLPWFLVKNMTLQDTCICMAISFTLLAAYFTGVSIPWPAKSKSVVSLLTSALWAAIFIRIILTLFYDAKFLDNWPITLAAGIFLCVIYCGPYKDKQIQNAHIQLAASTIDINEKSKLAKMRITSAVERFFIGRLNRCSQKIKYLWGAIYLCIATALSSWRQILLITLGIIVGSGFLYHKTSIVIILFITLLVILSVCQNMKLPVHSQMLVAGGRRERFYGTLAAAISSSIVIGLLIILIAVISPLISLIIAMCVSVSFIPITMHSAYMSVYIAIGIVPLFFGLTICFERAPLLTSCVIIVISMPAIILTFLLVLRNAIGGLLPITLIVISCWVFLIFVLRSICYGKDLILQTDKI